MHAQNQTAEMSMLDEIMAATAEMAPPAPEPMPARLTGLLDEIMAATVAAPAAPTTPPVAAVKPVDPSAVLDRINARLAAQSKPVARPVSVSGFQKGQYVMYRSNKGTNKRYKVVAVSPRTGALKLEMLGHYAGDRLAGRQFWAKVAQCVKDTGNGGTRFCTACGESGCNIGPFAVR